MIKYLFLLTLCITCNNSSAEYGTFMLGGTKWVLTDAGDRSEYEHFIEFDTGTITHTQCFYTIEETIKGTTAFYFTPTYPEEFNPSLIGKGSKGKYMVEYSNKNKTYKVFEIIKLTGDSLILIMMMTPKNMLEDLNQYENTKGCSNRRMVKNGNSCREYF